MRILLIAQYFKPESVGAAIWIHQLAVDIVDRGHDVTIVTGFPNYPSGEIFPSFKKKIYQREIIDGVNVVRTYIYASSKKTFTRKLLNFSSFSLSAGIGAITVKEPDVIYAILPPLPLGITSNVVGWLKRAPVINNIQDIWPDAPIAAGLISNGKVVKLYRFMESLVYRYADRITVISDGFKSNLLAKNVAEDKIEIVSNWADPDAIQPGEKYNSFRRELRIANEEFCLLYSGGLTYNSCLEIAIEGMQALIDYPIKLVIVGDGVKKENLLELVQKNNLDNVQFVPFQPLERYPEVLAAADMCLVTLGRGFSFASVPSKTFKIMAAARPILALATEESDLGQLVLDSKSGICVDPDDVQGISKAVRDLYERQDTLTQMGNNGRNILVQQFSRDRIVAQIEELMQRVARNRGLIKR